jgi:hypothetical protein
MEAKDGKERILQNCAGIGGKTIPLSSCVAVCKSRAVFRLPMEVNAPVAGLYSSALAKGPRRSNERAE